MYYSQRALTDTTFTDNTRDISFYRTESSPKACAEGQEARLQRLGKLVSIRAQGMCMHQGLAPSLPETVDDTWNVGLQDKKFSRACAEGQEVYQRRLGKEPATKFRPHDFLHPGWSDDSDEEAAEDRYDDLRPLPVSAEKVQDCSAEQALLWLYSGACTPTERPKVTPLSKPRSLH